LIARVRADERERMAHLARVVPGGGIRDVRGEVLADLRAQVEALHAEALAGKRANKHSLMAADAYVARAAGIAAVLALIDGSLSDESG
jgi:hypothetical protein